MSVPHSVKIEKLTLTVGICGNECKDFGKLSPKCNTLSNPPT